MKFPRATGILLHPTSFPGGFGIGDLGDAAFRFVDFLATSGLKLWQIMPLGPTGYGDSPYASFSAFAGNPLLISPERLAVEGWLVPADLAMASAFPEQRVDFGPVIEWKRPLLRRAYERFDACATEADLAELQSFVAANREWLDDYVLFMALKEAHGGGVWSTWEPEIAHHEAAAVQQWTQALQDQVRAHTFLQWQFARQWSRLKAYANEREIQIIGDIPIFVAYDSADVWAHPHLFHLDERGSPTVVAGVPPDYFSETGQLWGNPLYRWDRMRANGYHWWVERFRHTLTQVDIVRIDHFRGFEAYWEVAATERTAVNGRWVKGPGADLFAAVEAGLGALPIVAEDLGYITPEVEALRDALGFPGMRILQFAFSADATDPYLPHNYPHNTVVFTGSHDNDTTLGWYEKATEHERDYVRRYLNTDGSEIAWLMVRLAFSSVANQAIVPLQDILSLGSEARMNMPGQASGNWGWRYREEVLTPELSRRVHELVRIFGR
ncbi:MAG: 4-alpha-glucanotransferase [Ardenticatenaceae bacterium]|nr:4-alpha-glucanotransferase [Ardenticatenaceae bacterium]HBY97591.1 4-alpha-glucanotransferase [Chloroflexota bacterium]